MDNRIHAYEQHEMMIFANFLLAGFLIFNFAEVCLSIILKARNISAIMIKLINLFYLDDCER